MSSLLDLMAWDATDQLELIDRYMTDEAFPEATGTDGKELFLLDGAQHIETSWIDKYDRR